MAYAIFFSFSTGLAEPIKCPVGTLSTIVEHVAHIEAVLGLKPTRYKDNPLHWDTWKRGEAFAKVDDKTLCREVTLHNDWVRWVYHLFTESSKKPPAKHETITPEGAAKFWHGLEILTVPVSRWTPDYYRGRMEHLFEVMRGRESEGVTFDTKALNERQAAQIVNLFSEYLDRGDLRLDCPASYDCLRSSNDGGYTWCEKCGPVGEEDFERKREGCRRRGCSLKRDYGE